MVRRLLASVFLAAFPVVVIPVAVTSMGAPAGAAPPTAVQQCKNGGWQRFTDASGQPFENQGRCISYFIHNPISLADLAGSFSGTESFTFGTGGCAFVEQVFDATYPGSSAVGSVTLHLDGCIILGSFPTVSYAGTFAITTSVGTLAGAAAGPINNLLNTGPPVDYELTLKVLSGTGTFAGATGTMHLSMEWPQPPPFGPPVTGSVTVP
jgi:hypothetical protein